MIRQNRTLTPPMMLFKAADSFPEPDFPLVASYDSMPHNRVAVHRHELSEMVIVNRGSGIYRFGAVDLAAAQGDVFVISPGEEHALHNCADMSLTLLLFQRDYFLDQQFAYLPEFVALFDLEPLMRPHLPGQRHLRLSDVGLGQVLGIHQRLQIELAEQKPAYRQLARAYFQEIIGLCCRAYAQQHPHADTLVPRMAAVVSHINQHLCERIRLGDLAEVAGCSVNQLGRLFQQGFGQSPGSYFMQRRLQMAAEYLRTSHYSVTTIAFECGFSDGNYLSKQFKKYYRMSPREWCEKYASSD